MGNAVRISGWEESKIESCDICDRETSYKDGWIDNKKSIFVCEICKNTEDITLQLTFTDYLR